MVKDKKSEKKAAAPKIKADKKGTTAKVPSSKEILKKAKKVVNTFNYFRYSINDDVVRQKSATLAKVETNGKKVRLTYWTLSDFFFHCPSLSRPPKR